MIQLLQILRKKQGIAISLHRELMSCTPALNPEHGGIGEDEKANWIEAWLRNNGLCQVQCMDSQDQRVPRKLRPNLVAHYNPPNSECTLWIVTHMDVCASGPTELWESDPFILRVDGDILYGRGVEDNNQGIISALLLLDAIKELDAPPPIGLGLICSSAGLTDYSKGIEHILHKYPSLFKKNDLIIVPDYGSPSGDVIEIGEKLNIYVRIEVQGKEYHAGFCSGVNAFEAAAFFITHLKSIQDKFSIPNPIFTPPTTTVTPTYCENSSTGYNHVPARFVFYLDIRLTPDFTLEPIIHELQLLASKVEKSYHVDFSITYTKKVNNNSACILSEKTSMVKALSKAINEELHVQPKYIGIGGCTMASSIRELNFPALVWSIQSAKKNQVNEHISLSGQIKQTCVLARLLYEHTVKHQAMKVLFSSQQKQKITNKEQVVANLVGKGLSNEEISIELKSSINTIRTHLKSLYRKTGAQNRKELAQLFIYR